MLAKILSFFEFIVAGYFLKYLISAAPLFALDIPIAVSFIFFSIFDLVSFSAAHSFNDALFPLILFVILP